MTCTNGALCADFDVQSRKTWNLLKNAHKTGLSLGEETVTDLNLMELQSKHHADITTFKFSKYKERISGADWEWWLIAPHKVLGLRVQAKIINPKSLVYEHLDYSKPAIKFRQIDNLINYSAKKFPYRIPVYVLYNYWDCDKYYAYWPCTFRKRMVHMLGCGIVEARSLRQIINNGGKSVREIGQIMFPWSCPICCSYGTPSKASLPERAFQFLTSISSKIFDIGSPAKKYEKENYVVTDAPWYVEELMKKGTLSEDIQKEIGVNMITVIKENF